MERDEQENYYAILGVPADADQETIKRAYRQLARRYHPDLAGPEGATQMKRINRAYAVLGDPQKRQQYDVALRGVLDVRSGLLRPRRRPQRVDPQEELEFASLSIFSTRGPLRAGARFQTALGVISALGSVLSANGDLYIAAGSLDGQGAIWSLASQAQLSQFRTDPALTVESLRELRFSPHGELLAGWGRLGLHVWETQSGSLVWSYPLQQRTVFDHYTLDLAFVADGGSPQLAAPEPAVTFPAPLGLRLALPYQAEDPRTPRKVGVRATDVLLYQPSQSTTPQENLVCIEEEIEKRQFWAIRLRALSRDTRSLLTLSCGHAPGSQEEVIVVRRWDLTARTRFGNRPRPRIVSSVLAGACRDCAPPYAVTPDLQMVAFAARQERNRVRVQDLRAATYYDLAVGPLGGTSRLALSDDASWLAVAREESEIDEGVVELWSLTSGQLVQKLYHPWQISALHFADRRLLVALTDGTVQLWE
ncbi:DnaJ domain-containing protein [Thermogemmatispora sp.]|uniref:DnaJ domain-containing protein n=1 Tax=Thermogemmatispora sp. TaxID=1968838 RepID=UPI0035E3FE22